MAEITLAAETGRTTGSRSSLRLLAQGKIPAVVYGQGADTEAGLNALISLQVDGTPELCIVKDLQRNPVRQTVTHLDFLRIRADELLTVDIPLVLTGEAEAVTREGGMVD